MLRFIGGPLHGRTICLPPAQTYGLRFNVGPNRNADPPVEVLLNDAAAIIVAEYNGAGSDQVAVYGVLRQFPRIDQCDFDSHLSRAEAERTWVNAVWIFQTVWPLDKP